MKFKRTISAAVTMVMACVALTAVNVNAATYTRMVDNDPNSTAQAAGYGKDYYIEVDPIEDATGAFKLVGTINQKYAASGWSSLIKTVNADTGYSYIASREVTVEPSSGSYKQLGADAISLIASF